MTTARMLGASAIVSLGLLSGGAASAATDLQWWHSMNGKLGEKLEELATRFNESQGDFRVVPVNKGTYPESMTAAIAAFRAGEQPHLLQVFEVGTGTFMAAGDAIYPVYELMDDAEQPFDPSSYLPAVTGYYSDADGNMLSFPFNSSTMIFYYNKDAFEAAGLDPNTPPKTWSEVADAATRIVESGTKSCGFTTTWPSWANIENFSAWHNIPIATEQNGMAGFDTVLEIDNDLVRQHWSNLVEWQKTGAYQYGGRTSEAGPKFRTGECAMLLESSAGRADILANAQFEVGIGMMPYYDTVQGAPQNSIIGGASLWVMRGKDDADYDGVAQFLTFLSTPEVQAEWHQFTGYLPITEAAYELTRSQGFYDKNPGADTAIKQMTLNEPTDNSKGLRFGNFVQIRAMFEEELENALAERKTAAQALTDAQTRGNEMLREFEAQAN
ncbi:sn-glycerol-3-phosphate ABC transporter substrate-binding protein UgpB [Marinivivus vitaminiproducens]|uniref:sn-glycerol-3-phosphate ABC transporter substrate-binding protein UgpB n=1 Tax=Marinivivus vitaminiproducens TaxID=3035935 RepID=UPI0027AA5C25|nr:sn-glycerol-3-phosphate ABC transporter substrate-binding protein UgpB [Geminicoccaceae bacterium SCSIO 64248]